jgi:hypothetical protein
MKRLLLFLAACGDGGAALGPPCGGDAGIGPDLGEVDTGDSNVHRSPMLSNIFLEIFLSSADPAPDLLEVELYAGLGVFSGGPVRTGSYELEGRESFYSSCGACVLLLADRDPGSLQPSAYFMPVAGRLRVDQVDGRLSGVLEDVVLRHVTIDLTDPDGPDGELRPSLLTVDVPGGCHTRIGRAAFDVGYEE